MHAARRASATLVLTGTVALVAAGCGSSSTSTQTVTASVTHTQTTTTTTAASADYCRKLKALKQQALTINASQGIAGLRSHAQSVQNQLTALKSQFSGQFTPKVNAVQAAVGKVKTSATELSKNPSARAIGDATTAVKDLTTSVNTLVTSAQASCKQP